MKLISPKLPLPGRIRIFDSVFAALACIAVAGCHAKPYRGAPLSDRMVVTVRNEGPDIRQLEVDYPNASFGKDVLPSGASYLYQPKIIGSGPIKITFTDQTGKSHTATGPTAQESEHKDLVISIGQDESIVFQADTERTH